MTGPIRRRAATEEKTGSRRDRTRPPAPEPLPHPVVDNHCHLDIADGDEWLTTEDAIAAAAAVGVTRIVQIGCDLPGARWAVEAARRRTTPWSPASRCTPTRRRGWPRPASSTPRWTRSSGWPRATTGCAPSARPDSTTSAPARRGGPPRSRRSARHIDLAKRLDKTLVIHDRDAHEEVLARASTRRARPSAG